MKVILNSETTLEVIGCGHLLNGRTTILMHSTASFETLAAMFDGIRTLSAEQVRGIDHYTGHASLVAIHRNEGSDVVSVTVSGLEESVNEGGVT